MKKVFFFYFLLFALKSYSSDQITINHIDCNTLFEHSQLPAQKNPLRSCLDADEQNQDHEIIDKSFNCTNLSYEKLIKIGKGYQIEKLPDSMEDYGTCHFNGSVLIDQFESKQPPLVIHIQLDQESGAHLFATTKASIEKINFEGETFEVKKFNKIKLTRVLDTEDKRIKKYTLSIR